MIHQRYLPILSLCATVTLAAGDDDMQPGNVSVHLALREVGKVWGEQSKSYEYLKRMADGAPHLNGEDIRIIADAYMDIKRQEYEIEEPSLYLWTAYYSINPTSRGQDIAAHLRELAEIEETPFLPIKSKSLPFIPEKNATPRLFQREIVPPVTKPRFILHERDPSYMPQRESADPMRSKSPIFYKPPQGEQKTLWSHHKRHRKHYYTYSRGYRTEISETTITEEWNTL